MNYSQFLLLEGNNYAEKLKKWFEDANNKQIIETPLKDCFNEQGKIDSSKAYAKTKSMLSNSLRMRSEFYALGLGRLLYTEVYKLGNDEIQNFDMFMANVIEVAKEENNEDWTPINGKNNKDFCGKTYQEIKDMYKEKVDALVASKLNNLPAVKGEHQYRIELIPNAQTLTEKYSKLFKDNPAPWCILNSEQIFKVKYTNGGKNAFYVCVRDDCETVELPQNTDIKNPYDDYGLSFFAVIISPSGDVTCCTSRWNYAKENSMDCFFGCNKEKIAEALKMDMQAFNNTFQPLGFNNLYANCTKKVFSNKNFKLCATPDYKMFAILTPEGKAFQDRKFFYDKVDTITNESGKVVARFVDGLLMVKRGGKYGFIDETGVEKVQCIYDTAEPYNEGVAIVSKSGKYGFIGQDGNAVGEFIYDKIGDKIGNMFTAKTGNKWRMLSSNGQQAFKGEFDSIGKFVGKFAAVTDGDKVGILQKENNTISWFLKCEYDNIRFDEAKKLIVVTKNEKTGFLTIDGKVVLKCDYDDVTEMTNNDKFFISELNGKFGLINKKDYREVAPCKYDYIYQGRLPRNPEVFFIPFIKGDYAGYFNDLGQEVGGKFEATYPFVMATRDGYYLALVKKGGKFGYIDDSFKSPNQKLSCQYDKATQFSNGKASVVSNGMNMILSSEDIDTTRSTYSEPNKQLKTAQSQAQVQTQTQAQGQSQSQGQAQTEENVSEGKTNKAFHMPLFEDFCLKRK